MPYALAGVVAACVACFVAVRLSYPDGAYAQTLTDLIALSLAGAAGTVSLWMASRRCAAEPRTASAWKCLSLALAFVTATYLVAVVYQLDHAVPPFPSVGDALALGYVVFMVVGFLRFSTGLSSRSGARRLLIDAVMVVVAAASVIWFLVLGPAITQPGLKPLTIAVTGAYPVGEVLVTFAVVYTLMRGVLPAARTAVSILAANAVALIALDTFGGWLRLEGHFSLAADLNIGYLVVIGMFVIGAACQRPLSAESLRPRTADVGRSGASGARTKRTWIPYLGPAIVFGLLIAAQVGSPMYLRIGLAAGAAVLTTLVLLRQFLAQDDLISVQGELSHLALHDALTGLPNRALVLDRGEQMLARSRREMAPVAALYIDIDGFKQINDTFGHAAGDELLRVIAARLSGLARTSDTVGRMGGDELVVLLDSLTLDVAPELVAERMLEVLRQPITLTSAGDRALVITASIGIAVAVRESADELLRDADLALYQAKAAGKNCFVVFESSMETAASDRLLLEMDLREGVEERQFFLAYQPTFDLRTETVTGVEALVRWRHPTRGVIPPDEFIPIAEQTGIIVQLGRWVLEEACRQAMVWHGNGQTIGMSVNVSGRQLDDDQELVEHVRDALDSSGLAPSALTLEITETALMRKPHVAALRLTALKALGVRIAIDDFGTGCSSMAYLQQFPVDALKIDRSFISGIASTDASAAIVHSLVQLGKTLDLEVLGEGIEEGAQLRSLQSEQCDSGQGFLFARPLEPDQIESFIRETNGPVAPSGRAGGQGSGPARTPTPREANASR